MFHKFLLLLSLCFVLSVSAAGQKVEVSQEFLDDANKSFVEVVLLRQAVVSLENASAAKDETIAAKNEVIKAKEQTIELREEQIEFYRKLKCDKTSFFFGLLKNTRCH